MNTLIVIIILLAYILYRIYLKIFMKDLFRIVEYKKFYKIQKYDYLFGHWYSNLVIKDGIIKDFQCDYISNLRTKERALEIINDHYDNKYPIKNHYIIQENETNEIN